MTPIDFTNPFTYFGLGAAALGLILTFLFPVNRRRVNQGLITALIVILFFVGAFCLFDIPLALVAGTVASLLAIIYRDVLRFVKEFMWHNVYRYTHRYFWYQRVGRAILGGDRRRRRRGD